MADIWKPRVDPSLREPQKKAREFLHWCPYKDIWDVTNPRNVDLICSLCFFLENFLRTICRVLTLNFLFPTEIIPSRSFTLFHIFGATCYPAWPSFKQKYPTVRSSAVFRQPSWKKKFETYFASLTKLLPNQGNCSKNSSASGQILTRRKLWKDQADEDKTKQSYHVTHIIGQFHTSKT